MLTKLIYYIKTSMKQITNEEWFSIVYFSVAIFTEKYYEIL